MTDCVNVHPCPRELCGAELCDTHEPECISCLLHDEHGYSLPNDPHRYDDWPKSNLGSKLRDILEYSIIRRSLCVLLKHKWTSLGIVGHPGGPVIHWSNHCRRCYTTGEDSLYPRDEK